MKAFACKMCGACCYGEGGISIDDAEIERISTFLGTDIDSFVRRYCEERNGRTSITTNMSRFCIFYAGKGICLIHRVKPEICSLWPFYPAIIKDQDNWELAKEACPGINPDFSFDEFVRQAKETIFE